MSKITTHVLDTAQGKPAQGVAIVLEHKDTQKGWTEVGKGATNSDGRCADLVPADWSNKPGMYRITFETSKYFASINTSGFYPYVKIVFEIVNADEHYHIPLLLSPYGYSTYRGS